VLDSGKDALLERLALIEAAERSIDLQYYIWNSDLTGRYVAERIYAAADRGVRVRVLLDDINTNDRDAVLASLDSHPGIEIRIYNPIAARSGARRWFGFARDFAKANRRMHNKSLTVDGAPLSSADATSATNTSMQALS
jgi:putative cardiolipin synthase